MKGSLGVGSIIITMMLVYFCGIAIGANTPYVLDIPVTREANAQLYNPINKEVARNPFFWPGRGEGGLHPKTKQTPFKLEAIIWNGQHPLALINGKLVEEGDAIGDGVVMAIEKDMVLIREFDGEDHEIHIKNDILEVLGK